MTERVPVSVVPAAPLCTCTFITLALAVIPYELTVYTGDKDKAGTDAQVYVKLFGTNGSTSEVKLKKEDVRFERGREDFMRVKHLECLQLTV